MRIAITRAVSPRIGECELTHLAREPIDFARAVAEHASYEAALADSGCTVVRAAPAPDLPDAVFVEDTAVVLDEVAVLTRPGAASRRAELETVAVALAPYRTLLRIEPPATLDGGDVLRVGRHLFVGASARTSADGIAQLGALLQPHGYRVHPVPLRGCLHLKSAACAVSDDALLVNPAWVDPDCFPGLHTIEVDPSEPFAANVLRCGSALIAAAAHPRTTLRLRAEGLAVRVVAAGELARAEGGVTCCCLLFSTGPVDNRA